MGSTRMVRATALVTVAAGLVAALGIGGLRPAWAATPAPPLPACAAAGSFNIADRCGPEFEPAIGWGFGIITGVETRATTLGGEVTFSYPVHPPKPLGEPVSCGDLACIAYGISWRGARGARQEIVSGCTPTSVTCTVRYWGTGLVGDAAERYGVMYAELYLGRTPQDVGTAYLTYAPPAIYPVRLDPVDSSGARTVLPRDFVAYAIAPGRDPVEADCVDAFWFTSHVSEAQVRAPDCVTLRWDGYLDGSDNWFGGWLPEGAGSWTVVGAPAGDPGQPLLARRSPYRQTTVTPAGDDLHGTIVGERRPSLSLLVAPVTTEMALGSTQVVEITVAAAGGEAGWLEGLRFADAGILRVEPSDGTAPDGASVLTVGTPDAVPPEQGFRLDPGQERTFRVELQASALGRGDVRAFVSGHDDLGIALALDQGGSMLVTHDGADDGTAPRPPVVTGATDAGPGTADPITGTVEGTPGTTVEVALAAGVPAVPGSCLAQMSGGGVTPLGTIEVTIGDEGTGTFSVTGPLDGGQDVYGTTRIGGIVSSVGPCTPVEVADRNADRIDLRGEWQLRDPNDDPFGTVTITKHDRASGRVAGSARGRGITMKVSGTLKGTRLTLTFVAGGTSNTGAGKVVRDAGTTSVLLRSRDGKQFATLVLLEPAGG